MSHDDSRVKKKAEDKIKSNDYENGDQELIKHESVSPDYQAKQIPSVNESKEQSLNRRMRKYLNLD